MFIRGAACKAVPRHFFTGRIRFLRRYHQTPYAELWFTATLPLPTPQLFSRLARLVYPLDSPAVALLVRMVVTLCHRHRLVPGEVVDLFDRDAEIQ